MRLDFDPVDRLGPPDMPPHLRNGNSTHFPLMLRPQRRSGIAADTWSHMPFAESEKAQDSIWQLAGTC
jgi:hypothetical protein